MKLLYATSIYFPSPLANRIQIRSMATAFAKALPHEFMLGITGGGSEAGLSFPRVELRKAKKSVLLAWRYLLYARRHQVTHIFCREEQLLFWMLIFQKTLRTHFHFSYEAHHLLEKKKWWYRYILHNSNKVISLTHGMAERLVEMGVEPENILIVPDAVDIPLFDIPLGKDDARRRLKLPMDKYIILYAGNITEPWKGVGTVCDAAATFSDEYVFVVVGGKPHHVEWFKDKFHPPKAITMVGFKPHEEIPAYLKAADVLLLPNSQKEEISRISTSPMKLFEYMAAERPIIASDIPSLREMVSEKSAFLVEPDNASALAEKIKEVLGDPVGAERRAQEARREVEEFTWDKRAEKILYFIS
jgi:glycosyltransferase involved in cell wall biosynthesis